MIKLNTKKIRQFIDDKNNQLNAERIKNLKKKLLYSNCKFARDNNLSPTTFESIMVGENRPRIDTAYKIAKGIGCKIDDLLIITRF